MLFLSDCADFSRKLGSKDRKPRIKKLLAATINPNTANATAVGGGIGWGLGKVVDSYRKVGAVPLGERYGVLAGLATGAGLGIASRYKNKNTNK